jgi:uncharacterized protein YaeQ
MALTATIFTFEIDLSDVDRGVYEALKFKAAQHPSETAESLVTRALAYCLEFREGIGFSKGLDQPDEPALAIRDLGGAMQVWIDIGSPDAMRVHKASKATPRVVIYTHKDPDRLVRQLSGERIHKREAIEIRAVDRELIDALVARLDRRMTFALSVTDAHLFVTLRGETFDGAVERFSLLPAD